MPFSLRQKLNLLKVFAGVPAPIYVQFAVSRSCTMRCQMCNIVQIRKAESELDLEQIDRLADLLSKMHVGLLVLTGGEPMLREDIVEVVAAFSRRGITVRIQSNGLQFTRELLHRLRDAGLDGITTSLHSLSSRTLEELTGVPGALDKVFQALCLYTEAFPPGRYLGGINTVVNRANIEEIPRLIRFANAIGLAIALIPVHLAGEGDLPPASHPTGLAFSPADAGILERILGEARALKRQGYRVYNSDRFLRESVPFLIHGNVTWTCESPSLYFSISPSGTFLPCVDLPGRHSMLEPGFLTAWKNGALAREVRPQVAACRGCMYACYAEFSYLLRSKRMFARRVLDYRGLGAPTETLSMDRIGRLLRDLDAQGGQPSSRL